MCIEGCMSGRPAIALISRIFLIKYFEVQAFVKASVLMLFLLSETRLTLLPSGESRRRSPQGHTLHAKYHRPGQDQLLSIDRPRRPLFTHHLTQARTTAPSQVSRSFIRIDSYISRSRLKQPISFGVHSLEKISSA